MPSLEENLRHWNATYAWTDGGEAWSEVWGGSAVQWHESILPRIRALLPVRRGLEIACGFGRWSRFLRPWCDELVLTDLAPRCVEACGVRFRTDRGVEARLSDGRTFPGVPDRSLDFVFSFDSLVHADLDGVGSYVEELARTLSPNGSAFLHHSNFGAVLSATPGALNRHWRSEDVDAEAVASVSRTAGLVCARQEIVDWGGVEDCDCFSVIVRPESSLALAPIRLRNPHFMGEAQSLRIRAALYLGARGTEDPPRDETDERSGGE
jgi:SAM-dependent methyltransferase